MLQNGHYTGQTMTVGEFCFVLFEELIFHKGSESCSVLRQQAEDRSVEVYRESFIGGWCSASTLALTFHPTIQMCEDAESRDVTGDARGGGQAESVCQDSGHWSRVRLVCGGSVVTGGGAEAGEANTNVFYVSGTSGENTEGNVRKD